MAKMIVIVLLLITTLTGCAGVVMGDEWQAAHADGEAARAAAEWARTQQAQAEAAAATREAATREQARTITIILASVIGLGVLAGMGAAFVHWSFMRSRLVFADKAGLYPVVVGTMPATNLNEPGAQHARIAPGRAPYQVLPAPEIDPVELLPEPIVIDAKRMEHIERLLLTAPAGSTQDVID